jgi:O-methyltransferase
MNVLVRRFFRNIGYDLVERRSIPELPVDFSQEVVEIIQLVRPYTMTSVERIAALIQAVKYVGKARIPGSVVECGVWRGGSMMAVAHTLKRSGQGDRDLYLFDTFEGMTEPTDHDVSFKGQSASTHFENARTSKGASEWCRASIEDVRSNLLGTEYEPARLKFIKGKVEETIPGEAPAEISILRLDTDWYESTRHELIHLFPRLSVGGVLIIDDYGHWQGARKAVDEYFEPTSTPMLIQRIDYSGRIAVKR